MPQRAAVSISAMWYQSPASPVKVTTGRSGHAHFAPRPAGKSPPGGAAPRRELWGGRVGSDNPPLHMPAGAGCPTNEAVFGPVWGDAGPESPGWRGRRV